MTKLKVGVGNAIITPRVGARLVGYFNREKPSQSVHDDLHARALVINDGAMIVALCSVDLLWMVNSTIAEIRQAVAVRCAIQPENIFIFTTHTHSGPGSLDKVAWERPLAEIIADAIVSAYESQQSARLGAGFGQLLGYNINRRWLNRPTDPSVGVIRVDTEKGKPLAVFGNYACHAVVMGYDSYLISGDWPGYSSRLLEAEMGEGSVALFGQGGAGDVNPLTENVRQRLANGNPIVSMGPLSTYYAPHGVNVPGLWDIGDRGGGTFIEAETLARVYNAEVMRIWKGIQTSDDIKLWTERVMVDGRADADELVPEKMPESFKDLLPDVDKSQIEIMMVGIGNAVLVGQPGETFSENSIELRKTCQQMGYSHPMMVTYANGSFAYLPPANAFLEGGYEVGWALLSGLSRHLQDRIREAILPILDRHVDKAAAAEALKEAMEVIKRMTKTE